MESHPRTTLRTGGLRSLGAPRPLRVAVREGLPIVFQRDRPGAQRQAVTRIEDTWRIVDEWWREQLVSRSYFRVLAEDGRTLTLFHDDTQDLATGWFEQVY